MTEPRKAVALISGGLDSMLAAKVIQDQGIHVEGLNFYTGFCVEGHTHAIRKKDQNKQKRNNALWVADQLSIKLHIVDVIEDYKQVLLNPSHGYGKNMNPCLDCKIFMVNHALVWSIDNGFDFIITGEVIGQRPMSQRKDTMPIIARESGADDRLLRPLCAKNLPPTMPELNGWVDREQLHEFSGRNRKPQIAMAKSYGFHDFAQPSGGCCFLTDRAYSEKLIDLWKFRGSRDYELDDIILLKVGRHIRPNDRFKIIVGREEGENNFMEGYNYMFPSMEPVSHMGPLALLDGDPNGEDLILAASILARYSQGREAGQVRVKLSVPGQAAREMLVTPLPAMDLPKEWFI